MRILLIVLLLAFVSCSKEAPKELLKEAPKEVPCSNCNGTGTVTINVPELMAMARCQIYFANHARKCEVCEKSVGTDSDICEEATKKIEDIMTEAGKQPKDVQEDQCPMCGGSGTLIFEREGVLRNQGGVR